MGAEAARFAVIVPTYESEDTLPACLGSLRELEEPAGGYELVVVDGGSTDRTVEIARQQGACVIEAPGTGVAEARNRAAEQVEAEVLVFVDADCLAPGQLLTAASEHLDDHAVVGAFYEPADEQGWIARTWLAVERKPAGEVTWVPAGTMAVRRQAFADVGGFREDLVASEDVDLCRRLRAAGHTVRHEPAMASQHLGQPDTLGSFFANEVHRSRSLVASAFSGGLDTEFVTFLFAVGHIVLVPALVVAALLVPRWVPILLAAGLLPSLAWGLREAAREGWRLLPQLVALLVVYNLARAWSLIKHGQLTGSVRR